MPVAIGVEFTVVVATTVPTGVPAALKARLCPVDGVGVTVSEAEVAGCAVGGVPVATGVEVPPARFGEVIIVPMGGVSVEVVARRELISAV